MAQIIVSEGAEGIQLGGSPWLFYIAQLRSFNWYFSLQQKKEEELSIDCSDYDVEETTDTLA